MPASIKYVYNGAYVKSFWYIHLVCHIAGSQDIVHLHLHGINLPVREHSRWTWNILNTFYYFILLKLHWISLIGVIQCMIPHSLMIALLQYIWFGQRGSRWERCSVRFWFVFALFLASCLVLFVHFSILYWSIGFVRIPTGVRIYNGESMTWSISTLAARY